MKTETIMIKHFSFKNKAFSILLENHPNQVLLSISVELLTYVRKFGKGTYSYMFRSRVFSFSKNFICLK